MSVEIRVPALGESITEATVGRWMKKAGEPVVTGEPLVEIETEKVNLEVTAEANGVLERILRREGESVGVSEVLGTITEASMDLKADGGMPSATPGAPATPASAAGRDSQAGDTDSTVRQEISEPDPQESGPISSPSARRLAEELGMDLQRTAGSGPRGRVTREDVQAAAQREKAPGPKPAGGQSQPQPAGTGSVEDSKPAPSKVPPPAPSGTSPGQPFTPTAGSQATPAREDRIRLTRRRLTIARRLLEAQQTAAILTTFNEVDMTAVMEIRKRRKESFQKKHNIGLGFMSFFTKAAVGALKAFPQVNAELQGEELVLKRYYDIGIAVSTEDGLVVPVLRDADRKSFAQIEREIASMAERARQKTLSLQELMGGTFTITNGGVFGSLLSTPILNPPQVGILGMHRIQERPAAVEGQVVIRSMMYLALSYDHRVVDGREAVQFLVLVKQLIEDPETLLLEG